MFPDALPVGRPELSALVIASALCAALSAVIGAFELWPIMSAFGPLCGETRTGALLHCPACYLAIGFTALAIAACVARAPSVSARRHVVRG